MRMLLSIKPKYSKEIFCGTKKYEFRKVVFKEKKIREILVYESSPTKRVVGQFVCGGILTGSPESIWEKTESFAGIDKDSFFRYFQEKETAYAIEIINPILYEKPLELNKVYDSRPPQSFAYL